jgi:hypothetical protein
MEKEDLEKWERLRQKAALVALNAFLVRHKGGKAIKAAVEKSWEAANLFLRVGLENEAKCGLSLYELALSESDNDNEGTMRCIAKLDGHQDDTIAWLVEERYKCKSDLLAAYAEDDEISPKTLGQLMAADHLCMNWPLGKAEP